MLKTKRAKSFGPKPSPSFQYCRQHISSPTSITNIDVVNDISGEIYIDKSVAEKLEMMLIDFIVLLTDDNPTYLRNGLHLQIVNI